jgi:capsid protein
VYFTPPGKTYPEMKTIPRLGKSGRIMVTHGFEPQYAGQTRGFSALGIAAQELERITDMSLAEANKTVTQSNIAFYVKSNSDKPAVDPFANIGHLGAGPAAIQYGSDPVPSADAKNVTEESIKPVYNEFPEKTVFQTPGSAVVYGLEGQQDLVPFQNTAPGTAFNVFVDAQIKYISAALGQSIETTLMQFNNNYSASRATLILTWRIAEQKRYSLATYHLDPIYESWLAEEIAAGRVSCPGWADPRLRAAWLRHGWKGTPMPNIDPAVTMKAGRDAAELGASTLEEIAIEYNGSSAKANRAKLAKEYADLPAAPWATTTKKVEVDESPGGGAEDGGEKTKEEEQRHGQG